MPIAGTDIQTPSEIAGLAKAPTPPAASGPRIQDGGHYSWNAATGEVQGSIVTRVNSADDVMGANDILSSAHNARGGPVSHVDESSYVRFNGTSISVPVAVRIGALERTPEGGYRAPRTDGASPPAPPLPPAREQAPPSDNGGELPDAYGLDASELHAHEMVSKAVPALVLDAFVETVISSGYAALGSVTGQAIERAGLHGQARSVIDGLQKQADAVVQAKGISDPWQFYDWAKANAPTDLAAAQRKHYETGDARVYLQLVNAYRKTTR